MAARRRGTARDTRRARPERVVEDIGGEHDGAEGGERHDLLRRVEAGECRVELVRHPVRVAAELAAELHDRVVGVAQHERVRILARLDQEPPEERRADQAVGLGGHRVGEQVRQPLAQKRTHRVPERIPLHERVKRRHRVEQGALHVGDAADVALVLVVGGAGVG
jgi:hypothetical protein